MIDLIDLIDGFDGLGLESWIRKVSDREIDLYRVRYEVYLVGTLIKNLPKSMYSEPSIHLSIV